MRKRCDSFGLRTGAVLTALGMMMLMAPAAWAVAEAETSQEAAAPEVASAAPTGEVARSAFTSDIIDREPVDQLTTLENDTTRIYYFTELSGLGGQTVVHRWEYAGEVKAEVPFEVGSARWRVNSSKNLDPEWLGEWTVSVVDGNGNTLSVEHFSYTALEPETAPASAATP